MDNDVRHLVVKLAVIKAVADAVKEAEAATKAVLESVMDPGDRKTAALDGADVGTITYAKTSTTARVTDSRAFTAWVVDHYPTEVHRPVTVDADDLRLAIRCATQGGTLTGREDEVLSQLHDATSRSHAPLVVRPAFQEQVLTRAAKDGVAVDRDTGEVIPGVEVTPGGRGKYVSARITDEQRQALMEAWAAGKLDVLDLATTAPALEAAK